MEILKIPENVPGIISKPGRAKRCYELALNYILFKGEDGDTLVHGLWGFCHGEKKLYLIEHGWVETKDGRVWEPVSKQYFERETCYRTFRLKKHNSYSLVQAARMVSGTNNWGPWFGEERTKYMDTQQKIPVC